MLDVSIASVPGDYFMLDENYTVEYVEDHVSRSWRRLAPIELLISRWRCGESGGQGRVIA